MIILCLRSAVLYLLLILMIRLMGKRQVGQMAPSEFVVTMLAANLISNPMQDGDIPVYTGLGPMLTVLALELVVTASVLRSIPLRRLFCGRPVILIENGHILQENLRKTRITIDELMGHLRSKDVLDPTTVQYAILETDGSLSVFPEPKYCPASAREAGIPVKKQSLPLALVSDGQLLPENMKAAGKDTAWVRRVLQQYHAELADTWLLTVDGEDRIVFCPREGS